MSRSDGGSGTFFEELTRLGATALLSPLLPEVGGDPVSLDRDASERLVSLCLAQKLGPLLAFAVQGRWIVLDGSSLSRLREDVAQVLAAQLRVERVARMMCSLLIEHGFEFRVLKGLATANLDYPNPALRSFGDVDLLVRPSSVPTLFSTLEESGRGHFLPIRGSDWRIQHAVTFVFDGVEVDLHHRLLHQAGGHRAAKLDLFASPQYFDLGGVRVAAMPAHLRLLQAAAQNVLSQSESRKLFSDLDTVMLGLDTPAVDRARAAAASCGLAWILERGLERARATEVSHRPGWAGSNSLQRRERVVEALFERAYASADEGTTLRSLLEIVLAPPRLTAAILLSVVKPGENYLERRGRDRVGHLGRQLARLRRLIIRR